MHAGQHLLDEVRVRLVTVRCPFKFGRGVRAAIGAPVLPGSHDLNRDVDDALYGVFAVPALAPRREDLAAILRGGQLAADAGDARPGQAAHDERGTLPV